MLLVSDQIFVTKLPVVKMLGNSVVIRKDRRTISELKYLVFIIFASRGGHRPLIHAQDVQNTEC